MIGDRYGFTYSEIHHAYVYPNLNDHSLNLTFYDRNSFQARDSVYLFEYPFDQLMMILEIQVIDAHRFAVLIGKDYGEFTIRIIETEPYATDDLPSASAITVFPNPASGNIIIDGLPIHKTIFLYDITGKLLNTYGYDGIKAEINLERYPRGIVLLKVTDNEQKENGFITKIVLR